MQATFKSRNHDGNIASNRKEDKFRYQYTVITPALSAIIELRLYTTAARCYACIWVRDGKSNTYVSGGGYAGGYGYHKASQAVETALRDAGITLSEPIGGRGDSAIQDALKAIANELGYADSVIFTAHA